MRKNVRYQFVRFTEDAIRAVSGRFKEVIEEAGKKLDFVQTSVQHDDGATWEYDEIEEFYADYRRFNGRSHFRVEAIGYFLDIHFDLNISFVHIKAPTRAEVERVSACLIGKLEESRFTPNAAGDGPVVFIGHGGSSAWRELKDHLQDKHRYQIEAYETGARAGHTIRDILEDMSKKSTFALLVMTGEDDQKDGSVRARQNVIHEAGLFQGRLGFSRAILLLEEGVEQFSNVAGVQYIPFAKGNIKECFGEVLATLRREFS